MSGVNLLLLISRVHLLVPLVSPSLVEGVWQGNASAPTFESFREQFPRSYEMHSDEYNRRKSYFEVCLCQPALPRHFGGRSQCNDERCYCALGHFHRGHSVCHNQDSQSVLNVFYIIWINLFSFLRFLASGIPDLDHCACCKILA